MYKLGVPFAKHQGVLEERIKYFSPNIFGCCEKTSFSLLSLLHNQLVKGGSLVRISVAKIIFMTYENQIVINLV
jgi:hypothetical protein